ncbi:MAG TPA: hypothetical protein VMV98_08610 [Acidobacteriaceae bacterium]|nr:hypothetical protein [Acidobacteriaceae bacterium]
MNNPLPWVEPRVRVNATLQDTPELRVGVPQRSGTLCSMASRANLPVMVSASAYWLRDSGRFTDDGPSELLNCDFALDSAGFTAMANWKRKGTQPGMLGIFPWTLSDYVSLVGKLRPAWWSQPDACVEPELASDAAARIDRLEATEAMLAASLILVDRWQQLGAPWIAQPVPVLQGWRPAEYRESLDRMLRTWAKDGAAFDAPVLVGVGSMCRRPVEDPEIGILAVLDELLPVLPRGMKLHLFGVKSTAMARLASMPQVASFDSMAWDVAARYEAGRTGGPNTLARRGAAMLQWYERQQQHLAAAA